MSVHKKTEGLYEVRWREGGRQKSVRIHGFDVAKKVQHKSSPSETRTGTWT
jgi:hypothetical protein